MAKPFLVEIVTPERAVFSGEAVALTAPGVLGGFGILARHRPFMSALVPGVLELRRPEGAELRVAISGGFLEVSHDRVIILADTAEVGEEVDIDRARETLARARELLAHPTGGIDLDRARRAARRAEARLKAARK